jgi:hypothetical protein
MPSESIPNRLARIAVAGGTGKLGAAVAEIRDGVAGQIVADTTVPLQPPKVLRVQLPQGGQRHSKRNGCSAMR